MDDNILTLFKTYIGDSYVKRWQERSTKKKKKLMAVLEQGRLPEIGFSETDIEALFLQISSLDSNNWDNSVGVGEREGRVLVDFIRRRHYGFTHGIGRSGDVTAIQPKAPGSSLICRLTNQLLLDWLRKSGSPSTSQCFLVPMATGMSLTLCLLAMKRRRPPGAKFVLWSRIDQKSCFKCMLAADLIPVPIELIKDPNSDQLCTNLNAIELALNNPAKYLYDNWPKVAQAYNITSTMVDTSNSSDIVCILTTTNCFSPRAPDKLHAVTKLCLKYNVSHLINNAYGVQSPRCMRMIESAGKLITTDQKSNPQNNGDSNPSIDLLYVQSTDKNLMVPVGGAIIAGFSTELVNSVGKLYPGRASGTPTFDVLATLLHIGSKGWNDLIHAQSVCFNRLQEALKQLAVKHNLKLLDTPSNPISLALSLDSLLPSTNERRKEDEEQEEQQQEGYNTQISNEMKELASHITQIGANLFTQGCSGVRVVLPASMQNPTKLDVYEFAGFNSHSSTSTLPYINAAAAIGQKESDVDIFIQRLDKAIKHLKRTIHNKCINNNNENNDDNNNNNKTDDNTDSAIDSDTHLSAIC
ncbi:unnamed protein product [Trichobilharzia szidati]|nr:unnamed protein product [Trichobilharzia szidati]